MPLHRRPLTPQTRPIKVLSTVPLVANLVAKEEKNLSLGNG